MLAMLATHFYFDILIVNLSNILKVQNFKKINLEMSRHHAERFGFPAPVFQHLKMANRKR
jgi:hypothetical protein